MDYFAEAKKLVRIKELYHGGKKSREEAQKYAKEIGAHFFTYSSDSPRWEILEFAELAKKRGHKIMVLYIYL